tara:strand:- start:224 stop:457 length:234 start_codon:yes stop_codon:yes gene_type:complete
MQTSKHMYHASRYRARKRYYEKEENKEKKRLYMREYEKRPEVIARKRKILEASNENLHVMNTERFINYERRKKETQQ